jgi:hypothetical protein
MLRELLVIIRTDLTVIKYDTYLDVYIVWLCKYINKIFHKLKICYKRDEIMDTIHNINVLHGLTDDKNMSSYVKINPF